MSRPKMAPRRKRRRRVQKKIDKRFGLMHYDRKAIYLHKVALACTEYLHDHYVKSSRTLSDMFEEMLGAHRKEDEG